VIAPAERTARRAWRWIIAAFVVVQVAIVLFAANGPFVDESLYTVAGVRVLEGHGLADGYVSWFNGSPFAWPVLAAIGHHLGGLAGARLMAVAMSIATLVAFARTAETLFGAPVAAWATAALCVNGLFVALAHFAVYDIAALAALAVAMGAAARFAARGGHRVLALSAVAYAVAVICKYGYLLMAVPLAGLLISGAAPARWGRVLAIFGLVAGAIVAAYCVAFFGSPLPTSTAAYFEQVFPRSRGHIASLQVIFGAIPASLAGAGAVLAWRRGRRMLAATCLGALAIYPLFHVWTANFVSGQKHVVPGFLFGYLLAGLALDRLWRSGARARTAALLAAVTVAGGVQWYWQDHSWTDTRALTRHLVREMKPGDRVIAESSWIHALALYPAGLIASPADVLDATFSPDAERVDLCGITWVVGDDRTAGRIQAGRDRCRHREVLSTMARQYYFDTSRLWLDAVTTAVTLYRLATADADLARRATDTVVR
jgi:hypothetical protein